MKRWLLYRTENFQSEHLICYYFVRSVTKYAGELIVQELGEFKKVAVIWKNLGNTGEFLILHEPVENENLRTL